MCMKHSVYLCDECLKCRDPNIYCKYRSSCPIWFMQKRKEGWDNEGKAEEAITRHKVTFMPDGVEVAVAKNSTLLEAAQAADVHLNASCNGKGSCGKCKLVLKSGEADTGPSPLLSASEIGRNYLLACQSKVNK